MNARLAVNVIGLLLVLTGCGKEVRLKAEAVEDRAATPVLMADTVTTLISDSGVTRYRISTASWQVFDKAQPPYWEFTEGIYLEKFNEALEVEASLQSDYAHYDQDAERWLLRGNVHAMNLAGERFETEELTWDQPSQSIYSDSAITITKETSVIRGVGFRSNQTMSQYTILHPTGFFPIKD